MPLEVDIGSRWTGPPRSPGRASAPGGLNVIRKEAWPFYRTISGVRLCWELEEPEGPKGHHVPLEVDIGPRWTGPPRIPGRARLGVRGPQGALRLEARVVCSSNLLGWSTGVPRP